MRGLMRHRAVVLRDVNAGVDTFGHPLPPEWLQISDPVPCYAWSRSSREAVDDRRTAIVQDVRVMLPDSADVTASDRIENVTDRLGRVLHDGPFRIDAIERRAGQHKTCMVTRIS